MIMKRKHKQFILKKLIPFIMRERGRGFAMEVWKLKLTPGRLTTDLHLRRVVPTCGTIACIGGSVHILLRKNPIFFPEETLGLTRKQVNRLFFGYGLNERPLWPSPFLMRYPQAKTVLARAKVACDLLREIVRTDGKVLDG